LKKSIILILWLLFAATISFGQKFYHVWPYGYHATFIAPYISTSMMDFSSGSYNTYKVNHKRNFSGCVASLCDSTGKLILYTNGVSIFDAKGSMVPNGDSLNLGPFFSTDKQEGFTNGQSHYMVYLPGSTNHILLVHLSVQKDSAFIFRQGPIYISYIDRISDSSFIVRKKNQLVYNNGKFGNISIFKHGDGQRWWGLVPELIENKYHFFIIDSTGMSFSHTQVAGKSLEGTYCHAEGSQCISPDGSKFMRWSNSCGIRLFDVDRCTGSLFNPREISIDTIFYPGAGSAFSSNSRYLYVNSETSIYQIDTEVEPLKLLEVAKYDGYVDFFEMAFFLMDLQPDGKIYINTGSSNTKLHVIEYPDSAGTACKVNQHTVNLASLLFKTMSRHPNPLLGVLKGSPCDTSSAVHEPGTMPGGFSVYPNPAFDKLTIELDDGLAHDEAYLVRCYDMQGRVLYRGIFPPFAYIHNIDVSDFAAGMYLVEILNEEGRRVVSKFVKE
jgi:hypothetical protein